MSLLPLVTTALFLLRLAGDLGTFLVGTPTDAVDQPGSHTVVDHLEKGKSYRLLKIGGPDKRWCKLETPSGEGWVLCAGPGPAPTPAPPHDPGPTWSGNGRCASTCSVVPLFASMP